MTTKRNLANELTQYLHDVSEMSRKMRPDLPYGGFGGVVDYLLRAMVEGVEW